MTVVAILGKVNLVSGARMFAFNLVVCTVFFTLLANGNLIIQTPDRFNDEITDPSLRF